jgi:protein-tyrosine-phosphatase
MHRNPRSVLFACNLNRVRSPMAAALARRAFGEALRVESCGLEPAGSVDPFAAAVLDEVGVDVTDHEPKDFSSLEGPAFDVIVALTPEARERADAFAPTSLVEYWAVFDPTLVEGSRTQRLDAYRQTREDLDRRIRERFG